MSCLRLRLRLLLCMGKMDLSVRRSTLCMSMCLYVSVCVSLVGSAVKAGIVHERSV